MCLQGGVAHQKQQKSDTRSITATVATVATVIGLVSDEQNAARGWHAANIAHTARATG